MRAHNECINLFALLPPQIIRRSRKPVLASYIQFCLRENSRSKQNKLNNMAWTEENWSENEIFHDNFVASCCV